MAAGLNLKSRYRLDLLPLAGGGMGQVYPAVDLLFNRRVIVKFVNPVEISTDTLRRFQREAELTALLRHPAVPAVYDLDVSDGRPYLVMEYIDGTPLSDLVAEHGPLPLGWVCAIGAQVCGVLISADELGVIHQDIREWVAKLMRLDLATASPAELAKLDDATKLAEAQYVRQMLSLREYRPLVG